MLLIIAIGITYKTIESQQIRVMNVPVPPPGSSPKAQWMKEHNNGKTPDKASAGAPESERQDPNSLGEPVSK